MSDRVGNRRSRRAQAVEVKRTFWRDRLKHEPAPLSPPKPTPFEIFPAPIGGNLVLDIVTAGSTTRLTLPPDAARGLADRINAALADLAPAEPIPLSLDLEELLDEARAKTERAFDE